MNKYFDYGTPLSFIPESGKARNYCTVWARRIVAYAGILLAVCTANVYAANEEQRCKDLGAACACSEPLTGAVTRIGNSFFEMGPVTTKRCGGRNGEVFGEGNLAGSVFSLNDPTIMSRLPAASSIPSVLAIQGVTDGFMGGQFNPSVSCGTWGARWYQYRHEDYTCPSNSCKQFMFWTGTENQWARIGQRSTSFNFLAPGFSGHPALKIKPAFGRLGAWLRYEIVFENCTGPGVTMTLYEKNVTDNKPEKILARAPGSGWIVSFPEAPYNLTGPLSLNSIAHILTLNVNRNTTDGGTEAWSHFMIAAWPNPGHRIGSAAEIEGVSGAIDPIGGGGGGGSVPQTPATPTLQKQ